ncbi:uncharacterized protein LOC144439947 [Glandiceps talaboti]
MNETWLKEDSPDIDLEGFTCIRHDRDKEKTGKSIGGGLCIFVNDNWSNNYTIRETVSTKDLEILTVSFRPYYLPREFGQVTVILVYVPGPDNTAAAERIAQSYNAAVNRSVDQPVFILGDFNMCDISSQLPNLQQYVTCSTRLNHTLDKCYGNISDAFSVRSAHPLGRSDHDVIHLLPKYRQKLKTSRPKTKVIKHWTSDSVEILQACFECTDWSMFFDSCSDKEELSDTIISYIKFCEDSFIGTKTIQVFANTKPWVRKDLRSQLAEIRKAFKQSDTIKVREQRKVFRSMVKQAKIDYKNKVEDNLSKGKAKDAWKGLNTIMGKNQKTKGISTDDPLGFANELNQFYARFDIHDFRSECDTISQSLTPSPVTIEEREVASCFLKLDPSKASGPDGLKGKNMCFAVEWSVNPSISTTFKHLFRTQIMENI